MTVLNRRTTTVQKYPERILQFGGGNFLRAFVDWIIHVLNKEAGFQSNVVLVKPTNRGTYLDLHDQDGLYTVLLEGIKNGRLLSNRILVECVSNIVNPYKEWELYLETAKNPKIRFVISNTTESGIKFSDQDKLDARPALEFPAKLTQWLYERYKYFEGDTAKGCIMLPCELIPQNGDTLKKVIMLYIDLWQLGLAFKNWIDKHNYFCNTLVDRIVSGYPNDRALKIEKELGYADKLLVEAEMYHNWTIQCPSFVKEEFPVEKCDLNVVFTDNLEPYRTRKVRILNGAHTSMVPVAFLYGKETVRESVEDEVVGQFVREIIFDEICPTLDLPESELKSFANDVLDRFRNPYLVHALMSISLNSISKFKTRVLPSILEYHKRKNRLPKRLVFSFSSLILFYRGEVNGKTIVLNDDTEILEFFSNQWATYIGNEASLVSIVKSILSNKDFWDEDLTRVSDLVGTVTTNLSQILKDDMETTLRNIITQPYYDL